MSKSKDLRKAAVEYRLKGNTIIKTAEVFGVSKTAVSEWVKKYKETGDLSNKPLKRGYKKIDPKKLKDYVSKHPDALQKEIAQEFNCTQSAIWKALKRNKIARKKRLYSIKNKIQKKLRNILKK